MKRLILIVLFAVVLTVVVAGCAPETQNTAEPNDDGLHSVVPDVVGLSESEAAAALEEAGYEVGDVSRGTVEGAEPGVVTAQDPIPGTSVARGAEISLTVAE